MGNLKSVLIMAGGTGGHVFPGLAVAKALRDQHIEVNWLGTEKGLEARLVPDAGIPIYYISIGGLRGKGWKNLLSAPWRLSTAILQAIKIIRKLKPDVVLGMGGFVSGPGGIASVLLRRPLIIHEQNAKAGMTNKWLSYAANKILEGFPGTFSININKNQNKNKIFMTGNPVRAEIAELPSPEERFRDRHNPLHLLIVGGSLGAAAINHLIPKTLAKLSEAERPLVWHQTGERNYTDTLKAYAEVNISAEIVPFITEMDKAYAWADIVLCRAGALTIAELCAAGLGAILVPFPHAVDDHQTANAQFMVKEGAAELIQQADLSEDKLAEILRKLAIDQKKCLAMAQSAYKLRRIDAAEKVLQICQEVCR